MRANLLSIACRLRILLVMLPQSHRHTWRQVLVTAARLVARLSLFGLLVAAGCQTTVQTGTTAGDQSLRTRTVNGPSRDVFEVVARCIRQEYPDGQIFSDDNVGQISVTDYSLMHGDAVLQVTVTGRPNGTVDVSASATGLGANRTKAALERFLQDFDQTYRHWTKGQGQWRLGIN